MPRASHVPTPVFIGGPVSEYRILHEKHAEHVHAPHFHDCYEIHLHLRGSGTVYISQYATELMPLSVHIFRPYQIHRFRSHPGSGDRERLIIYIRPGLLEQYSQLSLPLRELLDSAAVHPEEAVQIPAAQWTQVSQLLTLIEPDASKLTPASRMVARGGLHLLLGLICASFRLPAAPSAKVSLVDPMMQQICQYLTLHFTEELRLEDVAARFSISKHHLAHRFTQAYGVSVYQYVLACRIGYSRQLILQGEALQSVSAHCGFNDYSNFQRAFIRQMGMPPAAWRRAQRQLQA